MYLELVLVKGKFYNLDQNIFKAELRNEIGDVVRELGMEMISEGYGITERDAVRDFIRRNKSNVIRKVFKSIKPKGNLK